MARTATSIRFPPKVYEYLKALSRHLHPDSPSVANAISHLARNTPPPEGLSPSAAEARRAYKEMMNP